MLTIRVLLFWVVLFSAECFLNKRDETEDHLVVKDAAKTVKRAEVSLDTKEADEGRLVENQQLVEHIAELERDNERLQSEINSSKVRGAKVKERKRVSIRVGQVDKVDKLDKVGQVEKSGKSDEVVVERRAHSGGRRLQYKMRRLQDKVETMSVSLKQAKIANEKYRVRFRHLQQRVKILEKHTDESTASHGQRTLRTRDTSVLGRLQRLEALLGDSSEELDGKVHTLKKMDDAAVEASIQANAPPSTPAVFHNFESEDVVLSRRGKDAHDFLEWGAVKPGESLRIRSFPGDQWRGVKADGKSVIEWTLPDDTAQSDKVAATNEGNVTETEQKTAVVVLRNGMGRPVQLESRPAGGDAAFAPGPVGEPGAVSVLRSSPGAEWRVVTTTKERTVVFGFVTPDDATPAIYNVPEVRLESVEFENADEGPISVFRAKPGGSWRYFTSLEPRQQLNSSTFPGERWNATSRRTGHTLMHFETPVEVANADRVFETKNGSAETREVEKRKKIPSERSAEKTEEPSSVPQSTESAKIAEVSRDAKPSRTKELAAERDEKYEGAHSRGEEFARATNAESGEQHPKQSKRPKKSEEDLAKKSEEDLAKPTAAEPAEDFGKKPVAKSSEKEPTKPQATETIKDLAEQPEAPKEKSEEKVVKDEPAKSADVPQQQPQLLEAAFENSDNFDIDIERNVNGAWKYNCTIKPGKEVVVATFAGEEWRGTISPGQDRAGEVAMTFTAPSDVPGDEEEEAAQP